MIGVDSANLVLINCEVITVDKNLSLKQAIAVKDDQIIGVGTNDEIRSFIGPRTRVLNLKGKAILPGINDAHLHGALFGATRPPLALDLTFPNIKSIGDIVEEIRKKGAQTPPSQWIRGFGWNPANIEECRTNPKRLPRKKDIDSVSPDHPVLLTDFSGHNLLANSKALELAGVNQDTTNPEGGMIVREPGSGEPTGILIENAQGLVERVVPSYTRDEKKQAIMSALNILKTQGITSITDAGLGPGGNTHHGGLMGEDGIGLYKELHDEGRLKVRTSILLLMGEGEISTMDHIKEVTQSFCMPDGLDKKWIRIPGVKIFADGIPRTRTAWMNEQYMSGGYGCLVLPGEGDQEKCELLTQMIKYFHNTRFQIGIHATGDRTIDFCVDALIKAMNGLNWGIPRHYIIHGNFVTPECAKRMATHNIGLSIQPVLKSIPIDLLEQMVGRERAAYAIPTRTCLDAGIKLTASSDAPITSSNWKEGVQCAVLRELKDSRKVSGPEQCVTVEEAVQMYTIYGAWQDHMDDKKGSIEVGKFADLCIIEENILTVDPHSICEIPVLMTIAGGEIVFDNSGGAFD
jgi:predicted amidohydrolase YtcJ